MSFLRKRTLSRQKSDNPPSPDLSASTSSSGSRDKPPKSRSVSQASSILSQNGDSKDSKPKRSSTLKKGKHRLSSLFSSSSLSSLTSENDRKLSPPRGPSHLSVSTSNSGSSTPTRNGGPTGAAKTSPKDYKAPDPTALAAGVENLRLGTERVRLGRSGVEEKRPRTSSLYSQWDADAAEDSDSSDDMISFHTPSEGLSLVQEEEEDARQDAASTTQGSVADPKDVAGTGPSTLRRRRVSLAETQVHKSTITARDVAAVDQGGVLVEDINTCREAIRLFLTSKMKESEALLIKKNPEGNRLYLQSGHALIQGLKGMMTFDANDLSNAVELSRGTTFTAHQLRRPQDNILTRVGGLVRSGAGVARVQAMTPLERHAELTYAEQSLMKALLAIFAGGDWLGLVREALNMRTAHGIYRTLQLYIEDADKNGFDDDIDMDFRSGVALGTGTSSLMLSLLPGKVLKIAEVFGYAGDRKFALDTLMSAGGWTKTAKEPAYTEQNEGLRRPVCDMILLAFHLVISVLMPVAGVDVAVARNILAYNMKRYPDGIFFLYFQARLHTTQCEPELAIKSLQRALDLPLEYVQLQHMCLWDFAGNKLMMADWKGALDCYNILRSESNWSRAVYTYATAACLIELMEDGEKSAIEGEADRLMKAIPTLTKKIAGKSLPIEKLASRKARKFESQGHRLFLPAMELAYVFGQLSTTPRRFLLQKHIPRIDTKLKALGEVPEQYGNGHEYWDDYCLGHFLRGVCNFTARYQPLEASAEAKAALPGDPSDDELDRQAEEDFLACLKHGPDVQLDHYIIYHCHFELGKFYARRGDTGKARHNFEVVMSGKLPEVNHFEKKSAGKYSLEGALMLKTHAALQSLQEKEKGDRVRVSITG